jgi:hypothetical protein
MLGKRKFGAAGLHVAEFKDEFDEIVSEIYDEHIAKRVKTETPAPVVSTPLVKKNIVQKTSSVKGTPFGKKASSTPGFTPVSVKKEVPSKVLNTTKANVTRPFTTPVKTSPFVKSTLQKLNEFQNNVPSRFKSKPDPVAPTVKMTKTVPKSPNFATTNVRSNRTQIAEGQALKPFKALPLNKKILEAGFAGYAGVPRVAPKKPTVPVEFNFKSGAYKKKAKPTATKDEDLMDTTEETFEDRLNDVGVFEFRPVPMDDIQYAEPPKPAVRKRPTVKRAVPQTPQQAPPQTPQHTAPKPPTSVFDRLSSRPNTQKTTAPPRSAMKATSSKNTGKPLADISSRLYQTNKVTETNKKPVSKVISNGTTKQDENKPSAKTKPVSRPTSRLVSSRV